jgi:hypothetical protein
MGQLAIVNAPASFTFIWGFIKPWLSKETVDKVDILGSDYQEVLLSLIDEENLPASLGGKCECEGGCEYSFAGPWKESLEERRERRSRQTTKHPLPVNGMHSIEGIHRQKENSSTEIQDVMGTKEHIGNGEVAVAEPLG